MEPKQDKELERDNRRRGGGTHSTTGRAIGNQIMAIGNQRTGQGTRGRAIWESEDGHVEPEMAMGNPEEDHWEPEDGHGNQRTGQGN